MDLAYKDLLNFKDSPIFHPTNISLSTQLFQKYPWYSLLYILFLSFYNLILFIFIFISCFSASLNGCEKVCGVVFNLWWLLVFTRHHVPNRLLLATVVHSNHWIFWNRANFCTCYSGECFYFIISSWSFCCWLMWGERENHYTRNVTTLCNPQESETDRKQ